MTRPTRIPAREEPDPGLPEPATDRGWLRRHLRAEDALVFALIAIVEPLLMPAKPGTAGGGGPDLVHAPADHHEPSLGTL